LSDPDQITGTDVPTVSLWWYREATGFATEMPVWARHLAAIGTDAVVFVFVAGMVIIWWRARRGHPRALAVALLGPVATAVAYLASETIKPVLREQRPCTAVIQSTIAACPPRDDWSFPSNHSVIAGAAGFAAVLACRSAAFWVIPAVLLAALSRVVVGVHYPHDVTAGVALGGGVALLVILPLQRPVARYVGHRRSRRRWRWLVDAARPVPDPQLVPDRGAASLRTRRGRPRRIGHGEPFETAISDRKDHCSATLMDKTRTVEGSPALNQPGPRPTGTLSTTSWERRAGDGAR
jgi:membrane-associated phospholipid phosphatase